MPSTEDLIFIVNGKTVTQLIPYDSVTIVDERGNRVGTADFTIENGAGLGLVQWQTVIIYSSDMDTVYFNGFIMDIGTTKQGIQVNYGLQCSSVEILLRRAIVDGDFLGTDDEILLALLLAGDPDLSDFFDFSSLVVPLLSSDVDLTLLDQTLLDALEALSALAGGAEYNLEYNDSARINIIKNPALTNNMTYYTGEIKSAATFTWQIWDGYWPPGNATWGAGFGETGGGIQLVSNQGDDVSGSRWSAILGIGASSAAATSSLKIENQSNKWLALTFRARLSSGGATVFVHGEVGYEDEEGVDIGTAADATAIPTLTGSWQTITRSFGLGGHPSATRATIYLAFQDNGSGAFTVEIDSVLVEILDGGTKQSAGAYFDGDTENAYWFGTAHASASALASNPMRWGGNPDAAFDIDIGNISEIVGDFNINFNGFNGINSLIVVGAYQWEDVDWEYPSNNQQTHFDLEVSIYPLETLSQPFIYSNIGSDETPNWSGKTVVTRQEGFEAGNCLYDLEGHWVEFQDPPPELKRSWRVVGRIKQRIRVKVQNEDSIDETGLELVDTLYLEGATTPSEAFDLGQAALANRAPDATVEFTTYEPGLKAGDEIDIADDSQGFDETLIIERVTRTYLGGGYGKFRVECGRYPLGLDDLMYETYELAEPNVPGDEDTTTVVVGYLVDQDGKVLLDQDGRQLLNIT